MSERSRLFGIYLTGETEQEIIKYAKEMEGSGRERILLGEAQKWVNEHPEHQGNLKLLYEVLSI